MQSKIEPNNMQTDDVACLQAASRVLDILISCFGYLPAILVVILSVSAESALGCVGLRCCYFVQDFLKRRKRRFGLN